MQSEAIYEAQQLQESTRRVIRVVWVAFLFFLAVLVVGIMTH